MKQVQFYKYASLAMLLLNVVLIVLLILGRPSGPPPPRGGSPEDRVRNLLGLDQQQHANFVASVDDHIMRINTISQQQQASMRPYFQSLTIEMDSTNFDAALDNVQALEREKIESLFQHFQEIKRLLRADQMDEFEAFVEELVNRNLFQTVKKPH